MLPGLQFIPTAQLQPGDAPLRTERLNYGLALLNPAPIGETATIIATGLGRSGTTMVARVMAALGVAMSPDTSARTAEDKKILATVKERDFAEFTALCRQRDALTSRWGFKCPALRNVMLKWEPAIRQPRYIIVFRDLLAIALRNQISLGQDLSIALQSASKSYAQLLQQLERMTAPALLISYEKALQYPVRTVLGIADFCGIEVDETQAVQVASQCIVNGDPNYLG